MQEKNRYFTKAHEWVRIEGKRAIVGITDFAQKELGDIVFVELPNSGDEVTQGQGLAVVESVKAVSDIYAPLSGVVLEVNANLADRPELINEDPYGEGWIAVLEYTNGEELEGLLSASAYQKFLEGEG